MLLRLIRRFQSKNSDCEIYKKQIEALSEENKFYRENLNLILSGKLTEEQIMFLSVKLHAVELGREIAESIWR
jgi:hypothetical protein